MDDPRYVVLVDARRAQGNRRHLRLPPPPPGPPRRSSRVISPHRPAARRHSRREPRHRPSDLLPLSPQRRGTDAPGRADRQSTAIRRVTGFAIDHRKVAPGTVFGAFRGTASTARTSSPTRSRAGAVAVVARPEAPVEGAVHIAAAEPRRDFARLAARSSSPFPETVVAVTGTNGKTSTVELTRQLWRMAGHHAASIGTLGVTTADEQVTTGLTTPDIVTFLSNMAGPGARGRHPCRLRGVEPRPLAIPHRGAAGPRPPPSPISAATISIITTRWRPISRPRCGCSTKCVEPDGTAVIWTDDPKSDEVIARCRARGLRCSPSARRARR